MRSVLIAVTTAVALVAAGCGGTDEAPVVEAAASGPTLDAEVLTGTSMTISGESFDLGSLADKDLVVWFWAPW